MYTSGADCSVIAVVIIIIFGSYTCVALDQNPAWWQVTVGWLFFQSF